MPTTSISNSLSNSRVRRKVAPRVEVALVCTMRKMLLLATAVSIRAVNGPLKLTLKSAAFLRLIYLVQLLLMGAVVRVAMRVLWMLPVVVVPIAKRAVVVVRAPTQCASRTTPVVGLRLDQLLRVGATTATPRTATTLIPTATNITAAAVARAILPLMPRAAAARRAPLPTVPAAAAVVLATAATAAAV